MSKRIMLVPVGNGVGLTSVSLGLVRAIEQQGRDFTFYKPIAQQRKEGEATEQSSAIINSTTNITPPPSFTLEYVENMLGNGNEFILLEEIVGRFEQVIKDNQIAVIEGLVPSKQQPYSGPLNHSIANALGADIVLVIAPNDDSDEKIQARLEIAAKQYGGIESDRVLGCIFNKVAAPVDEDDQLLAFSELSEKAIQDKITHTNQRLNALSVFKKNNFQLLGSVAWSSDLIAPRAQDLVDYLNAVVLNEGDIEHRRLRSINFCARTVANMVKSFKPGALIVTPGDRNDVFVAACLSVMNGTKIGAILLTGGLTPDPTIINFCQSAFDNGVPVLVTDSDTWQTSLKLHRFNLEVPIDDIQRIERVKNHTAESIDQTWINSLATATSSHRKLSPPAFRYQLTDLARKADKKIVLPEGNEPRTIKAAAICGERRIARTMLIGNPDEINRIAQQQGVILNDYVEIIDPDQVRDSYVPSLVEKRKHKGVSEVIAKEQLIDNVVLGTMMLSDNEVDGLVSGAVNTTANTIRPPLQIIKTAPGSNLVSSVFFMLLPNQVFVYGDCAINPDPTAEQLADIAIQSAESAIAFGIDPKVAMISYSTGSSGQGADVDKVRKATELAKAMRPDLLIDGPLQYDAAVMQSVAKNKAPDSPVAGQATVFIFPDLNTGNTTYKAVQRSAELVSLGPMLQGMGKPVNDLSRGALVDDIVYTIALTAIQATQQKQFN